MWNRSLKHRGYWGAKCSRNCRSKPDANPLPRGIQRTPNVGAEDRGFPVDKAIGEAASFITYQPLSDWLFSRCGLNAASFEGMMFIACPKRRLLALWPDGQ